MSKDEPLLFFFKLSARDSWAESHQRARTWLQKKWTRKRQEKTRKITALKSKRARTSLQDYFYAKITPTRWPSRRRSAVTPAFAGIELWPLAQESLGYCLNHLRVDECRWKKIAQVISVIACTDYRYKDCSGRRSLRTDKKKKTSEQNIKTHKLMSWSIS